MVHTVNGLHFYCASIGWGCEASPRNGDGQRIADTSSDFWNVFRGMYYWVCNTRCRLIDEAEGEYVAKGQGNIFKLWMNRL